MDNNSIEFPQNFNEFFWLLGKLRKACCKSILEIGSREGGSFFCFGSTLNTVELMVSIDLEDGPWGYKDSCSKLRVVCEALKGHGIQVNTISGDSKTPETISLVNNLKPFDGFDFIFIDGDHSCNGVINDWENYMPMIRKGGLIAFHDIAIENPNKLIKVPELWNSLKSHYDTLEMIIEWGIGIIKC